MCDAKPGRPLGRTDLGIKHQRWDEMAIWFDDGIPAFGIKHPTWSPLHKPFHAQELNDMASRGAMNFGGLAVAGMRRLLCLRRVKLKHAWGLQSTTHQPYCKDD